MPVSVCLAADLYLVYDTKSFRGKFLRRVDESVDEKVDFFIDSRRIGPRYLASDVNNAAWAGPRR